MNKQKRKRKRKRRTRPRPEAEQNPVLRLWNGFKADDALFEDRREYGIEDFKKAYSLTQVAAERLHYMFRQYEKGEII